MRRLERLLHEVHHTKTVVPSDMGRNAVKVEGLDFLLRELHEAAAQLPKVPYQDRSAKTGRTELLAPGHELCPPGEELGIFTVSPCPCKARGRKSALFS